jgi:hypothetical protein
MTSHSLFISGLLAKQLKLHKLVPRIEAALRLTAWLVFRQRRVLSSAFPGINLEKHVADVPATSAVSAKVSHFGACIN